MTLSLSAIEALAPDQASLKGASQQMKPAKWPLRGQDGEGRLIWGECQGSGANPYRVMADTSDHGYKCTCPSRKFPCKHVLALMWMYCEGAEAFLVGDTPEWVGEWLGRRRKPSSAPAAPNAAPAAPAAKKKPERKSLTGAREVDTEAPPDPKAEKRRQAAAEKRASETRRSVMAATEDLEQWIADQLRLGLAGYLNELTPRCRAIAARMVDGKAGALASRIDELPARLLPLSAEERLDAALAELGKLVLLVRAWRASPDDPELAREVVTAESREQVLSDPKALRVTGVWEVLGERVTTRRDGLVSQATWLLNLDPGSPRHALLLDFFPASAGRRGRAFAAGDQFPAELVFYRARHPLRAIIAKREAPLPEARAWPGETAADPLHQFVETLQASPWSLGAPVLLPPGRLCPSEPENWWQSADGTSTLPVSRSLPDLAFGAALESAAGYWNGTRLDLLAAHSDWGRLTFDG